MELPQMNARDVVLSVENLQTYFHTRDGVVRAVDGVSYSVRAGEVLGVVGESGCGKSITALATMGLLPKPAARIAGGRIELMGRNLLDASEQEMRGIRGNDIAMIFQEPMSALNPVLTVGFQVRETLLLHRKMSKAEASREAVELLRLVQIPDPDRRAAQYPHELSGGMRQRVMIAMAIACDPKVLIADEPTTALDVTVQMQILSLLLGLRDRLGTAIVLITHDMGVVAQTCDRVAVLYAGQKVEEASVKDLFHSPRHPYTRGLLASMPRLSSPVDGPEARLREISGTVPNLARPIRGCRFAERCQHAMSICREKAPGLTSHGSHSVACFLDNNLEEERLA